MLPRQAYLAMGDLMLKDSKSLRNFKSSIVTLCQKYGYKLVHSEEGIYIEQVLDEYDEWGRMVQDNIIAIHPSGFYSEDD